MGLALDDGGGGNGIGVHLFFLPQLLCHNQIIEFSFCLFAFKGFLLGGLSSHAYALLLIGPSCPLVGFCIYGFLHPLMGLQTH